MPFDLAVIDLDNTLYPATNGMFSRMNKQIKCYVLGINSAMFILLLETH